MCVFVCVRVARQGERGNEGGRGREGAMKEAGRLNEQTRRPDEQVRLFLWQVFTVPQDSLSFT